MALIDVVTCEFRDGEFCSKFPSDDLRIGTQLVVYPAQTAFFVKGGAICDEFTAGTYTIKTNNIPLLNKIINLPFGKESPFKADVWFVNQVSKLDMPWGTPHPIQLEDPKYKIIVPVRAHGQYGFRINNPRLFLETLIGNMSTFSSDQIDSYFKGRIISLLNSIIAQKIVENQVSVLDINTQLMQLSEDCEFTLNTAVAKYGIGITDFSIISITIPQDDPSVVKLKEAKDFAARLTITGRDTYQMERSFDVLERAASNQGVGGQMMAMGAGLGTGVTMGNALGNIANQHFNLNPTNSQTPPPIGMTKTYYLYLNGQQVGELTQQQVAQYIQSGMANGETMAWTAGLPQWVKLSMLPELSHLVMPTVPPPIM